MKGKEGEEREMRIRNGKEVAWELLLAKKR